MAQDRTSAGIAERHSPEPPPVPSAGSKELRVAAGVEVPNEGAEAVLKLDVPAVRPPVVHHDHPEVRERTLEYAAAPVPRRAGAGELVERIGTVVDADPIHAPEHLIEPPRRRGVSRCRPN